MNTAEIDQIIAAIQVEYDGAKIALESLAAQLRHLKARRRKIQQREIREAMKTRGFSLADILDGRVEFPPERWETADWYHAQHGYYTRLQWPPRQSFSSEGTYEVMGGNAQGYHWWIKCNPSSIKVIPKEAP